MSYHTAHYLTIHCCQNSKCDTITLLIQTLNSATCRKVCAAFHRRDTAHKHAEICVSIAFLHSSVQTYNEDSISDLMFCQWCSGGFRSVRNAVSLGKQFLTSSIPLWLLHPEDIWTHSIPALGITHPPRERQIMDDSSPQQYRCGNPQPCRTQCVYKIILKTEHSRHMSKNNQSVRNLPLLPSPHGQGSCVSLQTIFAHVHCLDRCPAPAVRTLRSLL